jgi:coenzyme F420-0:L-glutamate ligase
MDARLCELVLQESGAILGGVDHVLLAEVSGLLIANAGIDQSNAGGDDKVVLLPKDLQKSADEIRAQLEERDGVKIGVILADSRVQPLKVGVIGMALSVSGFVPIIDCRGKTDLFGRVLRFKQMAVADDIASAAELLMGECDEAVPFALARGAPIILTDEPPVSMVMPARDCLFMNILTNYFVKEPKSCEDSQADQE